MKKILVCIIFAIGISSIQGQAVPPPAARKIQLAILFDTSNSMDGLIDQAKSRIWNIVNEASSLRYNGSTPSLEIALFEYGNDGLSPSTNYIRQIVNLTTDLDLISEKLFALTTNGGSEFCGAVIEQSLNKLSWSTDAADLKMIYIAGNEPFNQGPVSYKEVCKAATKKGVYINTIYCGNYDQGVREFWKDGATCSNGDYFNIDSDRTVIHIDTPYDSELKVYSDSLNSTYYGYGIEGQSKKNNQIRQDANAETQSVAVMAERAIVKSKSTYSNSSWDLIDAVENGQKNLKDIDDKDLPSEFKGKTEEQKKALLEEKKAEREKYQKQISELAKKRQAYIDEEMKKRAEVGDSDDFGTSVNQSIQEKAKAIGYEKLAD